MRRVLIVDRNAEMRDALLRSVRAAGFEAAASAPEEAVRRVGEAPFDLAVVDVGQPEDLVRLDQLRAAAPRLALVACGSGVSLELAVMSMKRGACDFLRKPFAISALESALATATHVAPPGDGSPPLLTEDPRMERCLRLAEAAASTDATLQIIGESGTGKELIARWIHQRSARRSGPFVVVNCAALPESLAESELFGHERGSFTDAAQARVGQIAAAERGTLLFDEVSELSPALQPKLLRVVQEREVLPVGALRPVPVDTRIVATTQRDLGEEVAAGRFRADLYFRLDVIVLRVPPLRERVADVPLLARAFLRRLAGASGVEPPQLGPTALARLMQHPFRGNVRELENLMQRAVVLFPGREIDVEALLAARGRSGVSPPAAGETLNLRQLERRAIERSLAEAGGNRTLACRELGISVRTLRNKLRLYGLGGSRPAAAPRASDAC